MKKTFFVLSYLISIIFINCNTENLDCGDEEGVIISVFQNIESICYPNLPKSSIRSMDDFHLIDTFPLMDTSLVQKILIHKVPIQKYEEFYMDKHSENCIKIGSKKRFLLYKVGATDKWINNSIHLKSPIIFKDTACIEVIWSLGKGHLVGVFVVLKMKKGVWKIVERHETILG